MKKIGLIPAYKPDQHLIEIIEKLIANNFTIVLVNDGSDDIYDEIFNQIKDDCHLINHAFNLGKGEAIKTGLRYIKDTYHESYVIVTIDADGQHDIEDINNVAEQTILNANSLVLGVRDFDNNVPLKSKLGNTITSLVFKLVTGIYLKDTQTGLRGFSSKLIDQMIEIEGSRYEYEINVLLEMVKQNIGFNEVTIKTIYNDNNKGSSFNVIRDSYLIYKRLIKFALSSIIAFVIDYSLFILFSHTFKGNGYLIYANGLARAISANFNYQFNKKVVFKDNSSMYNSFYKYVGLVFVIFILNSFILQVLVTNLKITYWIAKLITELILFSLSYFIQQKHIFNNHERMNVYE